METKECTKCKSIKELTEFQKDIRYSQGVKNNCKICNSEYKKLYKLKNQEKVSEYNKTYKENNIDKIKDYEKNRFIKNKDKISLYNKQYKIDNKERDRIKNNTTKRLYKQKRIASDPLYKLNINTRSLIAISIKRKGYSKNAKSISILGCSIEDFKNHLESKFESWMNWDNYGKYNGTLNFGWDIDHIIPISSAMNEEEIIKLNHYTNLQPLCSYTNRYIKKAKPF